MLDLNKPLQFRNLKDRTIIRAIPTPEISDEIDQLYVIFRLSTGRVTASTRYSNGYVCRSKETDGDIINVPELVVTPGIYRTRNGKEAYVYTTKARGRYPAIGNVDIGHDILTELWLLNGRQFLDSEHEYDLVERIGDLEEGNK